MASEQISSTQESTASPMMAKILVPHDGTEASDKALEKAIELAKPFNSELIILNVIDDRFVVPSITLSLMNDRAPLNEAKDRVINYLKQGAEAMLMDRIEKVQSRGINVRFSLVMGAPSEEIARFAHSERVGLIVMGHREPRIKEKFDMLGSVARKVSEVAPCPVLIVR